MPAVREREELSQAACTPSGPEQGAIEDARRRQRARRGRSVTILLVAVALGAIAWALSTLGARGRARTPRPSIVGAAGAVRSGFGLRLSPSLDGGEYGWCVGILENGFKGVAGGGCSAQPVTSKPLVSVFTSGGRGQRYETIVVLTTPSVAAVQVNGRRRVASVRPPGLPYGLRAARIQVPARARRSRSGKLIYAMPSAPKLVALDSAGRPLASASSRSSVNAPAGSGAVRCALHAGGLAGLVPQWSHVAGAIEPFAGGQLVGRAFFSCIDTEYYLHRWPLDVAILLDAARPGSTPAAIPGLAPVAGHARYLNGPGDFKGELTATRLAHAWLVVAGGSGLNQRIEVLRHISATVQLPGASGSH
jgi:hypothetical protein